MVYTTTTSNISLSDEGIIINEFFGRSALKKAYLYEQANTLNHLRQSDYIPLLLDVSNIKVSIDEIAKLVTNEKSNRLKSLAIVVSSKSQQAILKLWFKFRKISFPLEFFTHRDDAKSWLKAYC
jgi:hypothetical protein